MASNSPYQIPTNGGPVKNVTSTTAPSLTNPAANSGFKNQMVTVGSDVYFVDSTGTAQKMGSSANLNIKAKLAPVIDFQTSAQLAALTTQNPGDSYIVTDGTHKGDIATWDGAEWQYYVPVDNDQTTVTTGASTGTWQYNFESDTWVQITEGIELPDPIERPVAGNFALLTQNVYQMNRTGGPVLLINDQLAAYGNSSNFNGGDTSAADSQPRKISWNWSTLQAGANAKGASYAPVFTDGAYNDDHLLAIDTKGKVWSMTDSSVGSGLTTTTTGTTKPSDLPRYALHPVAFFHNQDILAHRVYVSTALSNNTTNTFIGALTVTGDLYLSGGNAWGQLGIGNTTAQVGWVKYPIGNVVEVKMGYQQMLVRTLDNKLYFTGNDAYSFTGSTGSKTTPVLLASDVAFFDFGAYDCRNIHIVKTDANYWNMGLDANGQLGRGSVLASGGRPLAKVLTGVKKVFPGKWDGTKTIVLMTDGTIRVAGVNTSGMLGYTPNASAVNNPSFVVPTGSFQGTVVDGACGYQVSYLLTADGALLNAGLMQWRGTGMTSNNWTDNNRWQQVSLPEAVIGFRCIHEVSNNYEGCVVLMANHKVYGIGSITATKWTGGFTYGYSPVAIPLYQLDNGIALENPLELVITKPGTITSAALQSVSTVVDGVGNQTVTATIAATGTAGFISLTGSTASGPDVTFNSWTTSQVVMTAASTVITVQFNISAADIAALTPPNSQAQSWTINLSANGSNITINGSGLRIADAIAGALSASRSSYIALNAGEATEITAAEYASLMTLTGAAKYGTVDATMAGSPPNGGVVSGRTSAFEPNKFDGTYWASNSYLVAFSIKPKATTVPGATFKGLKVKFASNSYVAGLSGYATIVSNTDANPFTQKYFVVKPAALTPATARFGMYVPTPTAGNANDVIGCGATSALGYYYNGGGDGATTTSGSTNLGGPIWVQGIMTSTKQW